ncbi:MAG: hypothetical protein K9G47_04155 [Bacteroidales bacterium]|nr:hypothetical protein [Bacteroidales bacterium]
MRLLRIHFSALLFFLLIITEVSAQEYNAYLNNSYSYTIRKAINVYGSPAHTSVRPMLYSEVNKIIDYDSVLMAQSIPSESTSGFWKGLHNRVFNDHLIDVRKKDFTFQMDPLFHFEAGIESSSGSGSEDMEYVNTRGFQIRGTIGDKVGFYSSFYENQASFPAYIDDFIEKYGVVPGQGRPRSFGKEGYDFAMANGYVSYSPSKHFNFQFGHGKNFWGDGYRSLILSDNSFNYPFLKITTDFWRIKYVNLYAQFIDYNVPHSHELGFQRKYGTLHYLSINISKRVNLSLFEAIIWEAQDSTGQRGFDIAYLNPVIFYRPVEFSIGSPDNALLGLNLSVKIGKRNLAYGQLLLDEFKIKEVTAMDGWWGNKQAFQLGFKSFDAFRIPNLFAQLEYNYIRPYTYAHRIPLQAYGHYGQPLAHPIGANTMELLGRFQYHHKRFYFDYKILFAVYGEDENGLNYGKDIFKDYDSRAKDYDNFVGQGLRTNLTYNDIRLSYLINPAYNLNFSIGYINRMQKNDVADNNMNYFYVALRTSIENYYYDF